MMGLGVQDRFWWESAEKLKVAKKGGHSHDHGAHDHSAHDHSAHDHKAHGHSN